MFGIAMLSKGVALDELDGAVVDKQRPPGDPSANKGTPEAQNTGGGPQPYRQVCTPMASAGKPALVRNYDIS